MNLLQNLINMKNTIIILISILLLLSCKRKDDMEECSTGPSKYQPTPYQLVIPPLFPQMIIPADNPLTVEGVELGRHLFYEKRLSGDNTISCGSCHAPDAGFSDSRQFSVGIDGIAGTRQAMPLVNLGYSPTYFWDGRASTLTGQALEPVTDPIEMHETWPNAVAKLQADDEYPEMFEKAFGSSTIDSIMVAKAIAQFELTIISANSKFDKWQRREVQLTPQELNGFNIFNTLSEGDCLHCHVGTLTTDHSIVNNGLDENLTDLGRGAVTGNPSDNGKFKVPTLRNIALTAPYMHDGRFNTLEEVIDFYSTGVKANSPNISPNMEFAGSGGVNLDPQKKADLKAFLLTFTDSTLINNPAFSDPHN